MPKENKEKLPNKGGFILITVGPLVESDSVYMCTHISTAVLYDKRGMF